MILLTFTGSNDPFSRSAREGDAQAGPILTVLAERYFRSVFLFSTPRMTEVSQQTRDEIKARHPKLAVEILPVPVKDPTDYTGILKSLREMVGSGTFREDLYQRFGAAVTIPPLRQRKTDIPLLALHILEEWNRKHKKQRSLSPKALVALQSHHWPGNVRELRRVIVQSAILCGKSTLTDRDLRFEEAMVSNPSPVAPEPGAGFEINQYLDALKHKIVLRPLEKTDQVQARAARLLGWSPQALNQYLKSHR